MPQLLLPFGEAGVQRGGRTDWNLKAPWGGTRQDATRDPRPPFKIFDNVYYVGLQTVCAYLVTTSNGLVLIDATYAETADSVLNSIRALGFDPANIKYILITKLRRSLGVWSVSSSWARGTSCSRTIPG